MVRNTKNSLASKAKAASFPPAPRAFLTTLFGNVLASDIELFSTKARNQIASSLWDFVQNRKINAPKFRLYNPSFAEHGWEIDHTVLEIVNDDMPFLVASISGALQVRGMSIHHIIHPIFSIQRDAAGNLVELGKGKHESIMHIQLDRCIDQPTLDQLKSEIIAVLNDVRVAVVDWSDMRRCMKETIEQAQASSHAQALQSDSEEARSFLQWLDDDNFTYLGYRDIDLDQKDGKLTSVKVIPGSGLGILRDPELRVFGGMRAVNAQRNENLQRYVRRHDILVVTKTNIHSRVHRHVPLDAIFVRRFDAKGEVLGERLFVGLFTSKSYSQNPQTIPFLRRKVDYVLAKAGFAPSSHDGRAIVHILNNYPHDELLQIGEDNLLENVKGILQLQERARVAAFIRHDPFERFVTCLLYVPRDRYTSKRRLAIRALLEKTFQGKAQDWDVRIDNSLLARVFITITTPPGSAPVDVAALETELCVICRNWSDDLQTALTTPYGEAQAIALVSRYNEAFPLAYRDNTSPEHTVDDIAALERCAKLSSGSVMVNITQDTAAQRLHLKIFRVGSPILLSDTLPLVEQAGIKVDYMGGPYEITPKGVDVPIYIHEFVGPAAHQPIVDFATTKPVIETTLLQLWHGAIESDGFNALSLIAGMDWRDITIMRSFAHYLKQLRIPYSPELIVSTFHKYPELAQNICDLFKVRHNPSLKGNRDTQYKALDNIIQTLLAKIDVLEEDRIARRYLNLVHASLRTNFYQTDENGQPKPYLSIKFDSRVVEFMPLPKPLVEIFVYSPRTEAVHLRGGKVARGGIRWSDRRDDFRNEILGLMKAQMVKNTVIVPVGSKGGFILKRPPAEADKMPAEGIACYRIMMCGLLDITDNRVAGKIVPPKNVVRHDGDDPYLVVAADKGTAKFSDIANGISQEYGFWLDDAFASGGSVGYDHKQMGITARGAWEAIKRHFRELGKDIQNEDFTCMGVGDMSGDVFGNGMLLSKHIRLLGAFDHRHIFCDPNPDAAISFAERQRLFNLPRSSWDDYNKKLISKGGGIFPRATKSIKVSPEMQKAYGITANELSPPDLIQAMLKAEVELLYFGGIGTYVKASSESHEEAGDRTNEALRIDGGSIRAKVVGEGANLGFTQLARVEYAKKGGRINTDAIDNSAGVDTSDHEVNIKILMSKIVSRGAMSLDGRNKLLRMMTDDVAKLVLRDNYDQTQALSITECRAAELLPAHASTIRYLEKTGLLNRAVEFLPDESEIAERQRMNKGLTRPELAVVMAYAKLWLYQTLLDSKRLDHPYLLNELPRYFPAALQSKFGKDILGHQLSREIIATILTNAIINRTGAHTIFTLMEQTGCSADLIMCAFVMARDALDFNNMWAGIETLDSKVPANVQTHMFITLKTSLISAMRNIVQSPTLTDNLDKTVATIQSTSKAIFAAMAKLPLDSRTDQAELAKGFATAGVPEPLAQKIALTTNAETVLALTALAQRNKADIKEVTDLYFAVDERLSLGWLRRHAQHIPAQTPTQREAQRQFIVDLAATHQAITTALLGKKGNLTATQKLANWADAQPQALARYDAAVTEWRTIGTTDFATLMLAERYLAALG